MKPSKDLKKDNQKTNPKSEKSSKDDLRLQNKKKAESKQTQSNKKVSGL